MAIVQILIKGPPVNSEVLVHLINIESPEYCAVTVSIFQITNIASSILHYKYKY